MAPEVWALVGVVVGSVLGGGAQIVAGFLTDKRAHKRWLREQRVDAYRVVLETADSASDALYEHAMNGYDRAPVPEDWDGGVTKHLAALQMFGDSHVALCGERLAVSLNGFADSQPGRDSLQKEYAALAQARDDFLTAVRADLDVD